MNGSFLKVSNSSTDSPVDIHTVVVFYGHPEPSPPDKALIYDLVLKTFETRGSPPDRMSVDGDGFSGKIVGFRRTHSRLMNASFETVTDFTLYSLYSPASKWVVPVQDSKLLASFNFRDKFDTPAVILQAASAIAGLDDQSLVPYISGLVNLLKPTYGIGYRRAANNGPGYYAFGIAASLGRTPEEKAEREQMGVWFNFASKERCYDKGLLRDVYPWNFLNRSQLDAKIDGVSLERWIAQDEGRGRLMPINERLWHWMLTDAEITHVRPALWDADLIIKRHMFVSEN